MTHRLIWYSHVLHQIVGRPQDGEKAGQVTCRVRSYVEDIAVKEQSVFFDDCDLPADWDKHDLRVQCTDKLGSPVE